MTNYDIVRGFIEDEIRLKVVNRDGSAYSQGCYDTMKIILDLMNSLQRLDLMNSLQRLDNDIETHKEIEVIE